MARPPRRLSALAVVVLALLAPRGRAHRLDQKAQEAATEAINTGGTTIFPYRRPLLLALGAAHAFHAGEPPIGSNQALEDPSQWTRGVEEFYGPLAPEPVGHEEMQHRALYDELMQAGPGQPFVVKSDVPLDVDFVKQLDFDLTTKDGSVTVEGLTLDTRLRLFEEVFNTKEAFCYGWSWASDTINYKEALSESETKFVEDSVKLLGMKIEEISDKKSFRASSGGSPESYFNYKHFELRVLSGLMNLMQGKALLYNMQLATEEHVEYVKEASRHLCLYYTDKDNGKERILTIEGGPENNNIKFKGLPRRE